MDKAKSQIWAVAGDFVEQIWNGQVALYEAQSECENAISLRVKDWLKAAPKHHHEG
jgi:hypothetical protein